MADRVARAIKAEPEKQSVNGAAKAAPRFIEEQASATPFELKYPLEWDGQEYRRVEFRRLKGKDFSRFRTLSAVGVSEDEVTLSLITGLPVEVVQALDADDYLELIEKSQDFIPARFREAAASGPASETGQNTPE
jgi:Phage tail assembly chaperone proteins, E, or 41 or 14